MPSAQKTRIRRRRRRFLRNEEFAGLQRVVLQGGSPQTAHPSILCIVSSSVSPSQSSLIPSNDILGLVKNLVKVILYKNGMLNARDDGSNPLARLEKFYSKVIWPASVGRLPPSVRF